MAAGSAASWKARVCVVGAGISGLSSAVNILETIPGVDVTVIAEDFTSPSLTSNVAGGLWHPVSKLHETPLHRIQKWSRATWNHSIPLARSADASKIGIHFLHGYRLFTERVDEEIPWWKDDVFDFRRITPKETQLFPGYKDGYSYSTIVTENGLYLPYLMERYRRHGGRVVKRSIASLAELTGEYEVVVNCSGVWAKFLVGDESVEPSRGQIIKVRAPTQLFFLQIETSTPNSKYAIPRNGFVVLGGTKQLGRWNTTPDPDDKRRILESMSELLPNLKGCEIVTEAVGIRPRRFRGVRLEAEIMEFGSHKLEVVHNYGHDSLGVTFHWGCAQEVTQLVRQILARPHPMPQSKL